MLDCCISMCFSMHWNTNIHKQEFCEGYIGFQENIYHFNSMLLEGESNTFNKITISSEGLNGGGSQSDSILFCTRNWRPHSQGANSHVLQVVWLFVFLFFFTDSLEYRQNCLIVLRIHWRSIRRNRIIVPVRYIIILTLQIPH